MIRTKVDKTGRSTGIVAGKRHRRALGLPKGQGWTVPMPVNLLDSPALAAISTAAVRLLLTLMSEHGHHSGTENGQLLAPYDQLVTRGIRRTSIKTAIIELEAVGLVAVKIGRLSIGARQAPNMFRLTWLGTPDGLTATNEWAVLKDIEAAEARIKGALDRYARECALDAKRRSKEAAEVGNSELQSIAEPKRERAANAG